MEIARAFGMVFLVLSAILAASMAVVIVVNLITGGTLYIFGSANHDMGTLCYILVAGLVTSILRRSRKDATDTTTVSQTDQQVG